MDCNWNYITVNIIFWLYIFSSYRFLRFYYIRGIGNFISHIFCRTVSWDFSYSETSAANAYVYLCSQGDQGGTVGIAWVSGTCSFSRYGRSSINEYLRNDAITGAVSSGVTKYHVQYHILEISITLMKEPVLYHIVINRLY